MIRIQLYPANIESALKGIMKPSGECPIEFECEPKNLERELKKRTRFGAFVFNYYLNKSRMAVSYAGQPYWSVRGKFYKPLEGVHTLDECECEPVEVAEKINSVFRFFSAFSSDVKNHINDEVKSYDKKKRISKFSVVKS